MQKKENVKRCTIENRESTDTLSSNSCHGENSAKKCGFNGNKRKCFVMEKSALRRKKETQEKKEKVFREDKRCEADIRERGVDPCGKFAG